MVEESWAERVSGRITESALRLRRPARRFAGSVRSAVCIGAILVGAYSLFVGSIYCWKPWLYRNGLDTILLTSSGFTFVSAIVDLVLIYGVLIKEDTILKYTLCAAMAVYLVCVPFILFTYLAMIASGYFDVPLWEIPRFALYVLHLGVMYCLLAELRGDPLPPLSPSTPPPEGCLKNNLARAGPPAPSAADDALLKVHVTDNHNSSNNQGP